MKKLLWALLIVFSMVALASCSLDDAGNIGDGGDNTSTFDPNNVTMLSAYSQAQMLGFEGTLDEFIEMISGKDGITPTVEISDDGYWVINSVKTDVKAKVEFDEDVENPQGLEFFLKDDGTYAVGVGSAKYLSKIVIPTTYKGKAVTEIASFFADTGISRANSTIKEVVIPDTVTTIGEYAFYSCDSLTSVVIGDSVTSIGDYAFSHCSSLTSVVIPDSVTSIGNSAFSYCDSLTSVVIGDSVTSIGDHAFHDCDSLTSVVIPDSVTSIDDRAFSECDSLTSVVIPDSVTSIGNSAFAWCSSLTSVKYRGTEEQWNAITKGSDWNYSTGNYTITFNYDGE